MPQNGSSMAALLEKFAEFDRTATVLDMPRGERLNILNISEETYLLLRSGKIKPQPTVTSEIERRLGYALPLMRRLSKAGSQPRTASLMGGGQLQAA